MRKILLLTACVLGAVLFAAGCGQQSGTTEEQNASSTQPGQFNQNTGNQNASGPMQMRMGNMGEEIAVSDLAVGDTVTVMGTDNDDGTFSASRIMLGEMPEMTEMNMASGTPGNGGSEGDGQEFEGGEAPEISSSTMSAMQQRIAGGGMGAGGSIVGEIIKINGASLVIKLEEGGSAIIYYSDSTSFYVFSTSTP